MTYGALTLLVALLATPAYAQAPTASCKAQAVQRNLAGTAATSFLEKCQKVAATACAASAIEKKLATVAKTAQVEKCIGGTGRLVMIGHQQRDRA